MDQDSSKLLIDLSVLDLAVKKTIEPSFIEQTLLDEVSAEGFHHKELIPAVSPRLTKEALKKDPRGNLTFALKNHRDLLSKYESLPALEFVKQTEPHELTNHFIELLYGTGELETRVSQFLEWAKSNKATGGPKSGINPTVASFLLAMSNPGKYAFCKPSVYTQAAEALLPNFDASRLVGTQRIVHTTRFYSEVLRLFQNRYSLPLTDLQHVHIAFYIMANGYRGLPTWKTLLGGKTAMTKATDLNVILYGPPGTGKTYDTIRRAVEICDGLAPPDRSEQLRRFHQLREESRVSFITFHQAFGYEDFIEGLRPVLEDGEASGSEGTSEIRFECRSGVFKKLCLLAKSKLAQPKIPADVNLDQVTVWKMSLGRYNEPLDAFVFEECVEQECIRLGYGEDIDFEGCDTAEAVLQRYQKRNPKIKETDYTVTAVTTFKLKMKVGDLVVVSDGLDKFRAIGRITGEYRFRKAERYQQVRPVEWLVVFDESLPRELIVEKKLSQQTLYQLRPRILKKDAFLDLISGQSAELRNFVLIIDEINRGNIAKILGELITLLEPDKRLGQANELQVTLPYSGESFGVPSNVYVIGTMNTADRSIAFLDVALRRRFKFQEMMPDLGLIRQLVGENGVIDDVDVGDLLEIINNRIELLYDRDHQIGHSFFLSVNSLHDLRHVFVDKIIPLLQEYFYGDWGKVCQVLGCPVSDGQGARQVNAHPLVVAESLKRNELLGDGEDSIDDKIRGRVNPVFASTSSESTLREMFFGVVGKSKAG